MTFGKTFAEETLGVSGEAGEAMLDVRMYCMLLSYDISNYCNRI